MAQERHSPSESELRDELRVALAARKDLGPQFEDEIADAFLEKLGGRIDALVEQKLKERSASGRPARRANPMGTIAPALALSIPLTAIAGGIAGAFGIIATWAAIIFLIIFFSRER